MMKEAVLFVASTGVLIYFISPVSDNEAPAAEQVQTVKPKPVQDEDIDEDAEWEEDDSDEEEDFVFGEPMIEDEFEDDNDYRDSEKVENADKGKEQRDAARIAAYSKINPTVRALPKNPQDGEPGSRSNPVVLQPGKRAGGEAIE